MKKLINLKSQFTFKGIQGRMMMMSVFPVVLMTVLMIFVLGEVKSLSGKLDSIIDKTLPALTTSKEVTIEANNLSHAIWLAASAAKDPSQADAASSKFDRAVDRLQSSRDRYLSLEMTEKTGELRKSADAVMKELDPILAQIKTDIEGKKFDHLAGLAEKEVAPRLAKLDDLLSNIELNNSEVVEYEKAMAGKLTKRAKLTIYVGAALLFVASMLLSLIFSNRLTKRLFEISSALEQESDLAKSEAENISGESERLSSSAEKAAQAIQQTSAAVEQMSAMIQKNSNNANESAKAADDSAQQITVGKDSIFQIQSMVSDIKQVSSEMTRVVDESNKRISDISQVINEIGEKTKIINDIVFQTKLLSFNASVEAARAGEHGKGFAVVAEEVGTLAQSSGKAALEITGLLSSSTQKVEQIVEETRRSMQEVTGQIQHKIEQSEKIVQHSVEILEGIVSKSQDVKNRVSEISLASNEQSNGVSEVGKSMHALNEVANQNLSSGNQIVVISAHLKKQAQDLTSIAGRLSTVIRG